MINLILPCGCMKKNDDDEPDQAHLHKPRDNKLYQQNLKPCCMLVITTQKVVTLFVITGLVFLPIGITLLVQSTEIYQLDVHYTDCYREESTGPSSDFCKDHDEQETCICDGISIEIPDTVKGKVMFLYGLKNYYQNHRLYRQSQSFEQLLGDIQADCLQDYCKPYSTPEDSNITYYPKGAIANSYFTDTFLLSKGDDVKLVKNGNVNTERKNVEMEITDISWKSDRDSKFLVPANFDAESDKFLWPKDWQKWQNNEKAKVNDYDQDIVPKSIADEHLINWMNPAAFPSFTKLYAKVELDPGKYTLHVLYRYNVHKFGGEKFVRLAETSWMGGRSVFLGSAYVVVAIFCFAAAVFFAIVSRKTRAKRYERKKKIGEQMENYKASNSNHHSSV